MGARSKKLRRVARVISLQKSIVQGELNRENAQIQRLAGVKDEILEGNEPVFGRMLSGAHGEQVHAMLVLGERTARERMRCAASILEKSAQQLKGVERTLQKAEVNEVERGASAQFEELIETAAQIKELNRTGVAGGSNS